MPAPTPKILEELDGEDRGAGYLHGQLLAHVGNHDRVIEASQYWKIAPVIYRGPAGARLIRDSGGDQLEAGRPAVLDPEGYERDRRHGRRAQDLAIGSRLAVTFAPAFAADHRAPARLHRFMTTTADLLEDRLRRSDIGGQLVPTLRLTNHWLTDHRLNELLAEWVADSARSIAVVLANPYNPLETTDAIVGMLRLVATGRVVPLRGDHASIAFLVAGARFASAGTSGTVRHLYNGGPPKNRRPGPGHEVFHWQTHTWIKHYRLGVLHFPDWALECFCPVCEGRSIRRFQDPAREIEVIAHNIGLLRLLAWDTAASGNGLDEWLDRCDAAADAATELQRVAGGLRLGAAARAWADVRITA